jgi:hypothetical protein
MNAQADSKKLLTKERNAHSANFLNVVNLLFQPRLAPTKPSDVEMDSMLLKDQKMHLAVLVN